MERALCPWAQVLCSLWTVVTSTARLLVSLHLPSSLVDNSRPTCPPPPYTSKTGRDPWEAVSQRFSEEIPPTLHVCTNNLWALYRQDQGGCTQCGRWSQAWLVPELPGQLWKYCIYWPPWVDRLRLWGEPSCLTLDSSLFLIFPNDIILLIFYWCMWKKVPLISPHSWRSKSWNFIELPLIIP